MKVVINDCFGGFSLSPRAVKMWAERKGRPCFFFETKLPDIEQLVPITIEQAEKAFVFHTYDLPEIPDTKKWHNMTQAERAAQNAWSNEHSIGSGREVPRDDADLVAVVETLGDAANGRHASLKVIEIPDDIEWVVDEYDGRESIAEAHRSWS